MTIEKEKKFKSFILSSLFSSATGDVDIQKKDINGKGYPVVSSGLDNQGIIGYSDIPAKVLPANTITIDMFGNVFFRDFEYKEVTHARIFTLIPKSFELSVGTGLYIVSILSRQTKRFSYNNMASWNKMKTFEISLPVDADGSIDWHYMQERIAELEQERIAELDVYLKATGLEDYVLTEEDREILSREEEAHKKRAVGDYSPYGFEKFMITDLFNLQPVSEKVSKLEFTPNGKIPAYSSDTRNNGCLGFVNQKPTFCITEKIPTYLIFGDHTKTTNIVHQDFCVLDNVKVLIPKEKISDEALLYITTVWKKAIPNLGYARHWSIANKVKFKLPVKNNNIDIIYMERYIRATEKLVIADVVKYKDKVIATTKKVVNSST